MDYNESSQSDLLADIPYILLDVLKRAWLIVLAAIVTGLGAYVFVTESYRPEYTATTVFVVTSKSDSASVLSNITEAQNLAAAFGNVVNSNTMREMVAKRLGYNSFSGTISAQVAGNTNLITLTVKASTPQDAFKASRAIIEGHGTVTEAIMGNAVLQVLVPPEVPMAESSNMNRRNTILTVSAATAALAVIIIAYLSYISDKVRHVEKFAKQIDGRLIATICHDKKYKTVKSFLTHRKKNILITNTSTGFGFVETFNKIRTRIEYMTADKDIKTIMVTSVMEKEGKSTVSVNLAIALANKGLRVIYIDADMRKKTDNTPFDTPSGDNLGEVLRGEKTLADAIRTDKRSGLLYLCGSNFRGAEIDTMLSAGLKKIISEARNSADYVIIDTTPMSDSPDAEYISATVDGCILVVRQNFAKVPEINDVIDALRENGKCFMGCVFNNVRSGISEGFGYGYGYGYGKYYKKYYDRAEVNAKKSQ